MALDSVLSTPIIPPPPKAPASTGASKSSGGSSGSSSGSSSTGGAAGTSSNTSTGASGSSDGNSSGNAARTSGKSSAAHSTSSTQSKNASAAQGKQDAASGKTQSSGSAANANGKSGATQSGKPTGPSFIQTLAQSQAEAAIGVDAAATAAPEEVTGGKPKAAASDDDTDPSSASFAFLSQSLAAAMAGVQPAAQGQSATTALGDSADGVSLTSGSSVQSLVANLTKGVADELKAPVAATDDLKDDAAANPAPTADNSASAANAFQAHMSVSSHFQAATDPASNKIGSQVGTAAFDDEVGGKITWMTNQGVQSASLQLSPEHMGPVDVRISMQDGSASVTFSAAHADTRAALEQALPRLREMFATQGMSLSDASVSQQSPRGQAQKQSVAAIGAVGGVSDDSTTTTSIAAVAGARPGLVDLYA